jgi:hypothetical protein
VGYRRIVYRVTTTVPTCIQIFIESLVSCTVLSNAAGILCFTSASAWSSSDVVCWVGSGQMPYDVRGENARGGLISWLLYRGTQGVRAQSLLGSQR